MADTARLEISPIPGAHVDNLSKVGRILSSIGKFTVDSTLTDFLTRINGWKKSPKILPQEMKGSPPSWSLNHKKKPGDFRPVIRDVQEVVKKGQEEAIKMQQQHERCAKSLKLAEPSKRTPREVPKASDLLNTNRNRVFIRSRL